MEVEFWTVATKLCINTCVMPFLLFFFFFFFFCINSLCPCHKVSKPTKNSPLSSGEVLTMFQESSILAWFTSTISPSTGAYKSLVALTLSIDPKLSVEVDMR